MMTHDVKEELSVSPFHTIGDSPRDGRENGLGGLDNATVGMLISLIKGLLQRREHRPTWTLGVRIDSFQDLRVLSPYTQAFEVVKEGGKGWDETVKGFQIIQNRNALWLVKGVKHRSLTYFVIQECKIVD